jgi:HAD domain in Swiss Army Knife RNA repair proteins
LTQLVLEEPSGPTSIVRRLLRVLSESPQLRGKPLLFVDIDGVISLWGFRPDTCPPGTWSVVDGIPHFLSTRAAEHLLTLARAFDLVWCSGWEEKADEHLPFALGVPRGLPHLTFDGRTRADVSTHAHWKLAAVEEHAGDRPLAWIDDAFNAACRTWAEQRPSPTLLVPTEPHEGLTDAQAARLRAFAAELGAAA